MREFFSQDMLEQIDNSSSLSSKRRIELFMRLFTEYKFCVIPLKYGFVDQGKTKGYCHSPVVSKWQDFCWHKFPLMPEKLYQDRAGITCGPASGVIVIDIDDVRKFEKWLNDQDLSAEDLDTLSIKSGGRNGYGRHLYFRYPEPPAGFYYGKKKIVEANTDLMGVGAYVVCPGSLHAETRGVYRVSRNLPIKDAPQIFLDIMKTEVSKIQENEVAPAKSADQSPMRVTDSKEAFELKHALPQKLVDKCFQPLQPGQRSEAAFQIMHELVDHKYSDDQIYDVVKNTPIGDRFFEKPNPEKFFHEEIERVKMQKEEYSQEKSQKTLSGQKYDRYKNVTSMTLDDIVQKNVTFDFLIDKVWPRKESVLLSGEGGAGKSLFALNTALDLVSEGHARFLENYKVDGDNRVLIIQSENSMAGTAQRIKRILSAYSHYQPYVKKIRYLGLNNDIRISGDLANDTRLKDLVIKHIEIHEANVLIIDPLISFHYADENSNDQMRRVMDNISHISDEYNLSTLLIHHENKTQQKTKKAGGRGASAIGDWAAYSFNLFPSKGQNPYYILTHNKARDCAKLYPLKLELRDFRFIPVQGTVNTQGVNSDQSIIMNILKQGKQKSYSSLYSQYQAERSKQGRKPKARKTLKNIVDDMVNQNLIKTSKESTGNSYSLP